MSTECKLFTHEAEALHERFPDGTRVFVDTIDYPGEDNRPKRYRGLATVVRTVEDIRDDQGDGESGPMPPSISICLEVRPDGDDDAPWYVTPDDGYDTVEKIDA